MLRDGRTVLVNTGACRLYRVAGLDAADAAGPRLEMVHDEGESGCAMPVVIGDYWVEANAATHRVLALDVHDLAHVRAVSFDRAGWPHGATGTAVPHGTVFAW